MLLFLSHCSSNIDRWNITIEQYISSCSIILFTIEHLILLLLLVGGLEPFFFFHILGNIIPTDELIFFKMVKTTNQISIGIIGIITTMTWHHPIIKMIIPYQNPIFTRYPGNHIVRLREIIPFYGLKIQVSELLQFTQIYNLVSKPHEL